MNMRDTSGKRSAITALAAILIIAVALIYAVRELSGSPRAGDTGYYTTDDGQTTFADRLGLFPPFDYQGRTAVRAWMFTCDGGKTQFVGYLERFTPAAKSRLEAQAADFKTGKSRIPPVAGPTDTEVKKPGPNNPWINRTDIRASSITKVECHGSGTAEIVLP